MRSLFNRQREVRNILIIGAGVVGRQLAATLSEDERNQVTVLEAQSYANFLEERYDIRVVPGDATNYQDLSAVCNSSTNLVIAVTQSDPVNILVCMAAKGLGAKRTIARLRTCNILSESELKQYIDDIIQPEEVVTNHIKQQILYPDVGNNYSFFRYKARLFELPLPERFQQKLRAGQRVEISDLLAETNNCQIVAVRRLVDGVDTGLMGLRRDQDQESSYMVEGEVVESAFDPKVWTRHLQADDRIFLLARDKEINSVLMDLGYTMAEPKRIFIYGGTAIGKTLSRALQHHNTRVYLIEPNRNNSKWLAFETTRAVVLHGEGTDLELLRSEGAGDADVFIAVTENEEANITACVLAKSIGCKRTIALAANPSYEIIGETAKSAENSLPQIVSHRKMTVSMVQRNLMRMERDESRGYVEDVEELPGDLRAVVFEVQANVDKHTPVTGQMIYSDDFRRAFPKDCVIAAIQRGKQTIIADESEEPEFALGDRVLVLAPAERLDELRHYF